MNQNLSRTFDFLRFPLAIFVVYLHIAPVYNPWDIATDSDGIYVYMNSCINLIADCAVPIFFIISGYLISFKHNTISLDSYIGVLQRRIITLFIPYIIWNIICYIYLLATDQVSGPFSFSFVFLRPANFPLWFIKNLFLLTITYPIFIMISNYLDKVGMIVITGLFTLIGFFFPNYSIEYFSVRSVYFFYFGIFAGYCKWNLDNLSWVKKSSLFLLGILIYAFIILGSSNISRSMFNMFLLIGSICILILANEIVKRFKFVIPPIIVSSSYFIYLSHKIGPTYISKSLINFIPINDSTSEFIVFLLGPFITAGICIGIYAILKKNCPRIFSFMIGGK